MEKNKYSVLISNTAVFAIGNMLAKLIAFFLMPLYTSVLTTEQYGISELLNSTIEIVLPIATLCMIDALYRFSIDDNTDHEVVFSSALRIVMIGNGVVLFACGILKKFFAYEYSYYFFTLYLTTSLYKLTIQFARGLGHVKRYAFYGVLNSIILVLSNVILLVAFKGGIKAYLSSFSIGYGVAAIVAFIFSKEYKYISIKKYNRKITNEMLKYSLPNIPNMLSWWINSLLDRYIVLFYCGTSMTGVYTAASKLPAMINLITSIFQQAWQYSTATEINNDNSHDFFEKVFRIYSFVCIGACMIIVIMNKVICKILLQDNFYDAWRYVPLLMLAATFGCYSSFFGVFYNAIKKNFMLMLSTIIGAILNIILNFILIPQYGGFGAAFSTMVSYAIITIIRILDIDKRLCLKIDYTNLVIQIFVLIVLVFVGSIGDSIVYYLIEVLCAVMIIILNKNILTSFYRHFSRIKK